MDSAARRCSITSSSRPCWRYRSRSAHDAAEAVFATLAPELERLGAFARKKRGFNPPLDGWLKDDLKDRCRRRAVARAPHRRPAEGARVQAMIDAYATSPALAEQILSLVILDESLRQLAAEAADGG
jgi:asparagine synthase (glutamine-hydrolysing)